MRQLENWMSAYFDYTKKQESPDIFHFAGALSCLSVALGRNVYVDRSRYRIYPNHYVLVIAASALCRKSVAIGIALRIMKEAGLAERLISKISSEALWKELGRSMEETGESRVFIFADELSLFLSKREVQGDLIPLLTRLYTCPDFELNITKTAGVDHAELVCVNALLATTPADFIDLIPGAATGKGFTPRIHIMFGDLPRQRMADIEEDPVLREKLVEDLRHIVTLKGKYEFTPEAWAWWSDWYEGPEFLKGIPEGVEMETWAGRKHDHVLKLAMILAAARKDELVLELEDMLKALGMLNVMESKMVHVYGMVGRIPMASHRDRILGQMRKREGRITRAEVTHINSNKMRAVEIEEVMQGLLVENLVKEYDQPNGGKIYELKGKEIG